MYGTVKQTSTWVWGASGKHPVVKDYIRIGQDTPFMDALSRRIEEGYPNVAGGTHMRSWRFFARGIKPQELSCGLVRDSRDGAGRPFPLLIMGSGVLEKWERCWEYLPYSLSDLWERMEYISAKRIFDLSELKGDIMRLPAPPLPEWEKVVDESGPRPIPEQQDGMLAIPLSAAGDYREEIVHLLRRVGERQHAVPDAVFMGGTLSSSFLVTFFRSLGAQDFVRLWSIDEKGEL